MFPSKGRPLCGEPCRPIAGSFCFHDPDSFHAVLTIYSSQLFWHPSLRSRCLPSCAISRSLRRPEDPYLEKAARRNATSAAYSPDGQTLYTTTSNREMYSVSSDGHSIHWSVDVDDGDLCDSAVSPDGWSVRSRVVPPEIVRRKYTNKRCRQPGPRVLLHNGFATWNEKVLLRIIMVHHC